VNKAELINKISEKAHLSTRDSSIVVNNILEEITICLQSGHKFHLTGFGSFNTVLRPVRVFRNPKTGAKVISNEIAIPKFKPSKLLKAKIISHVIYN
jgi:nucleoid DNA-binding protein